MNDKPIEENTILIDKPLLPTTRSEGKKSSIWIKIIIFLVVACLAILIICLQPSEQIDDFPDSHPLRKYYDTRTKVLSIPSGETVSSDSVDISKLKYLRSIEIGGNTFLNVSRFTISDNPSLEKIVMQGPYICPNVTQLTIANLTKLTHFKIQGDWSLKSVESWTLINLDSLQELEFNGEGVLFTLKDFSIQGLPSLASIKMNGTYLGSTTSVLKISNLLNLKSISILGENAFMLSSLEIQKLPILEEVLFSGTYIFGFCRQMVLQDVPNLRNVSFLGDSAFQGMEKLEFTKLQHLEQIVIGGNRAFGTVDQFILTDLPSLKNIQCSGDDVLEKTKVWKMKNLPLLETITLDGVGGMKGMTDLSFQNFPRIRSMHLGFRFENVVTLVLHNLTSLNALFLHNTRGFPSLKNITMSVLPELESLSLGGSEMMRSVIGLKLLNLTKLSTVDIGDDFLLSGEPKGEIQMRNIPLASAITVQGVKEPRTPMYWYQILKRGDHVSDLFYSSLVGYLKGFGYYKDHIIEEPL